MARQNAAPLGEQVYLSLRDDLMTGRISPSQRLGEEKLAEIYNVSRTPVREALARLLADGLVQRDTDGLYPYRPRLEELAGLYELRITLELRGIERIRDDARLSHDPDVLGPELDHWYTLRKESPAPDAGFVVLDERFHTVLLASSGNKALSDALVNVNARVRPVRMFDYLTPDRMGATIDEHIQVAELVLDGDLDAAHATLLSHISESREVVIDRAEQALSFAKMAWAVRD
ncbi:GntR family transcriptional regulator [Rhodococcus triatomae]|uniref:DNA-binding transcriptional regulator, GntR family n=1 Tax=Rhodococcus triatomae TaxID=300028 RepID=A0A1G8RK79_9NOCA|nr:GntR family transcriptional regulator [Rhodococcus triatomae]QNG19923.1 GntR family transcriptional regulator [Rhodococcus triatomae]QNG24162.1 GntR family transcriptional regulator [Rhodococcus triatomae]SDJ17366.1 DNA-binding transcriptional regulator, GntR family [Rhodococcus triatomae]